MIYLIIWVIVGLLHMGILLAIEGMNDDSGWIVPVSIFWPISIVIYIGYGLGKFIYNSFLIGK